MSNERDDLIWLGSEYFGALRMGMRREMADAADFFGLPAGQGAYVIDTVPQDPLDEMCGYGLPFRIANLSMLLMPGVAETLSKNFSPAAITQLTGWRAKAYSVCERYWWISRGWAQSNLSLAATLCSLKTIQEAITLRDIRPRWIPALAAESYNRMMFEQSMGMQTALMMSDAKAAPDRITVARCSVPLLAAA